MNWYFHFCSPAFPNDPTIQFHRKFQLSILVTILIVYCCFYIYYYLVNPELPTN